MAKKKQKGTNGYVAELNKLVKAEYNGEIPAKLTILIRKTAMDMQMMDRISDELMSLDSLTSTKFGSMAQEKTEVSPLIPYYDKLSSRVTDDLYNLGLTARKQAVKVEDPGKVDDEDPMKKFYQEARK
jgi:hypothetical protein